MKGELRVGNKRADTGIEYQPELGETIIDIDRPNILSNPFRRKSRKENIELFEDLLLADIAQKGMMYFEMVRIAALILAGHGVILMCWCKPLPCHGDIIKREIDKIVDTFESGSTRRET